MLVSQGTWCAMSSIRDGAEYLKHEICHMMLAIRFPCFYRLRLFDGSVCSQAGHGTKTEYSKRIEGVWCYRKEFLMRQQNSFRSPNLKTAIPSRGRLRIVNVAEKFRGVVVANLMHDMDCRSSPLVSRLQQGDGYGVRSTAAGKCRS